MIKVLAVFFASLAILHGASAIAQSPPEKPRYAAMAPLDRYLIPNEASEIALARSAAPASISDTAEVMVLTHTGYATAANGSNGFVCIVERSWAAPTDAPDFWNPTVRSPNCFNPAAAKTFLPIYLMRTRLILAGKSKAEMLKATAAAFDRNELPALAPGAMCYMMSKQQYLNDDDMGWHPHVMFFAPGDAAASWGANLHGSPVIAADDPEEHATIFMVVAGKWSDGTPFQPMAMAH